MDVVGFVRDEGILALQPILDSIEIPFFRKGLQLVLDNRSEKFIRDSLSTEIEVCYREGLDQARVYETAGGFAPTMGIIGAVIGLIFIVQTSQDPSKLGQGVASAFSATLYGVAFSNLFLLPIAGKLRQQARDEWFTLTLLLEAVLSIRSGEHPMIIEERLNAFLSGSAHNLTTEQRSGKQYASRPDLGNAALLPAHTVMSEDFLQVGAYD
jgi:chemotaxis protein MotA